MREPLETIPAVELLLRQLEEEGKKPEAQRKLPMVNGYTLQRRIGGGAFAHVFLATPDVYGTIKAALKLPAHKGAVADINSRRIILSAFGQAPFITDLVAQGEHAGYPYSVEQYREKSLADLIKENTTQGRKTTEEEIVDLGRQLFEGADYFHRLKETNSAAATRLGVNSLTHCDIKPSNILIARGEDGKIKYEFTDFGVRIEGSVGTPLSIINSASLDSIVAGDKKERKHRNVYAAPEVQGALMFNDPDKEIPSTVAADLWSIGAVLYHFATNSSAPAWGDKDPRKVRADLPEGFSEFFGTILEGVPERRFKTARDAMKSLEESVGEVGDSFIFGISKLGDKTYQLFRQAMQHGEPVKALRTHDFTTYVPIEPALLYDPHSKSIILVRNNYQEGKKMVGFGANSFDHALKEKAWTFPGYDGVTDLRRASHQLVRNEATGETLLRVRAIYRKADGAEAKYTATYDVPTFSAVSYEAENYIRSEPIMGNAGWVAVEQPGMKLSKTYSLIIQGGALTTTDNSGYTGNKIAARNVQTAFWVPRV